MKHPLNVAYEAATLDLKDVNMIDSFHMDAYGELAVNYNRDIEAFPVLKRIIEKITGTDSVYKSPTDMGVNRVGFSIIDDEVVREASKQEIIRRYFKTACDYKKGYVDYETFERAQLLMNELGLSPEDRAVVGAARKAAEDLARKWSDDTHDNAATAVAIELSDSKIITGKCSDILTAPAAAILNAVKEIAMINDELHLISPVVIEPILKMKKEYLGSKSLALNCEEVLLALSICATTNPMVQVCIDKLGDLRGAQAHSTSILGRSDEVSLQKLGMDVTCDPEYATHKLYYNN